MWGSKIYVRKGRLQSGVQVACGRGMGLDPENRRMGGGRGGREGFAVVGSSAGAASGGVGGQRRSGGGWAVVGLGVDPWALWEAGMERIGVEGGDGRGVGWGMIRGPDCMGGVGGEPGPGRGLPWGMGGTVGRGGAVD